MKKRVGNIDIKSRARKTSGKKNAVRPNQNQKTKPKPKIRVVNKVLVSKFVNGKVVKQKIKRKCYPPEAIKEAMKAVNEGASLRKAAAMHGVPSATLCKKLKNPESIGKKGGPSTVLTAEEKAEMIKWLIYRAKTSSPALKSELFDCIQKYLQKEQKETSFKNDRPGKKWYDNFRKRHLEISLPVAQNLPLVRAIVTEEDLRQWFGEVRTFLEKKGLTSIHPSRIFNCDENNI
ncbi:uncharacterized protein LOC116416882 [Nasonia vitripennis]|uniref:HTH psq-type domain-containing protein n=1 Tax=Nasonia vitripennis TaxID=7425 RepID=A0A7M7Q957_NASVI|nr:uncharacterized protein LOC116416882 [Nasonia vitripennis]